MCTSFLVLISACIISAVLVAVVFLCIGFRAFLMYRIDHLFLLAGVGLSTENILYPCIETSASRCFSSVSSHVSLRPMISKFSVWVSTMISSILGGSHCTLARSTFNLLVYAWALAGGGAGPGAHGECGGWGGLPYGCGAPSSLVMLLLWLDLVVVSRCWGGVLVVGSWFGSSFAPEVQCTWVEIRVD